MTWLVCVVLFELWLVYLIPPNALIDHRWLAAFVSFTQAWAPVVGNFDAIATDPQSLNVYLAITVWLIIPKAFFIYRWLNSSYLDNYRHFVVSPLTDTSGSVSDFITAPRHREALGNARPRAMWKRVALSLVLLLLWGTPVYVVLHFGPLPPNTPLIDDSIRNIAHGGFLAWWDWAATMVTFAGLGAAAAFSILRDYYLVLVRGVRRLR